MTPPPIQFKNNQDYAKLVCDAYWKCLEAGGTVFAVPNFDRLPDTIKAAWEDAAVALWSEWRKERERKQ